MTDLTKMRVPPIKHRSVFPPLSQDHAAALGQVAASWGAIEEYCGHLIDLMTGLEPVQHAVLSEISFQQRLSIITSLVLETRHQDLFDHWNDMLPTLDSLRTARNDLVHGGWKTFLESRAPVVVRITARRRIQVKLIDASVAYLTDLEAEIIEMVDQLSWLASQINARGGKRLFSDARTKPRLDPTQSPKARALAQARTAKQAWKQAHRAEERKAPEKT